MTNDDQCKIYNIIKSVCSNAKKLILSVHLENKLMKCLLRNTEEIVPLQCTGPYCRSELFYIVSRLWSVPVCVYNYIYTHTHAEHYQLIIPVLSLNHETN